MVLYLLQQGAGINQVGEKQRTALYWAANKVNREGGREGG